MGQVLIPDKTIVHFELIRLGNFKNTFFVIVTLCLFILSMNSSY